MFHAAEHGMHSATGLSPDFNLLCAVSYGRRCQRSQNHSLKINYPRDGDRDTSQRSQCSAQALHCSELPAAGTIPAAGTVILDTTQMLPESWCFRYHQNSASSGAVTNF